MTFQPMNFISSLKYMGLGLLGIFVAIGIIALCIIVLNAISSRKEN